MKKHYLFTFVLLVLVQTVALAGFTPGYYDRMDGKSKTELKAAVKQCVGAHQTLVYGQLPGYWQYTDVYPELVDGCRRWWEMYSDEICLIRPNQTAFQSFSSYGMHREHSVPKSWWKMNGNVEYTPAYSDMWNLYPSNGRANTAKSNYPFGVTDKPNFDNGVTKVGPPRNGYGGGAANVFEPADEYKGDFARSIFYMASVYDDINWVINYMFRKEQWPTLTPWAVDMLLQWARTDRVSQKEIDRNNLVEQYQGNRNPFVDFPELAEYIWGLRSGQTFIISEQENADPTPPITGDPQITEPVNGESLDFGQTAVSHTVTRALQIKGSNFTSPLSVRVVGADRAYFTPEITSIPAATLNANGGYLLNITYNPTTTGTHEARITLYDGGLEGSVVVNLKGEALEVPDLQPLNALPATDIDGTSYTANWEAPQGIADYYVLTRIRYVGDNQEMETVETGETSLRLQDRDPALAETYTVVYSRLGMLSPQSNTIYVAADSGVGLLQTEVPFRVLGSDGGFMIITGDGEPVEMVTVADMTGRILMVLDVVESERFVELMPGIYTVSAPGHRTHKVMIKR